MRSRKNGEGSYSTVEIKGIVYQRYRYSNGKQIYARTMKELKLKKEKYEKELKEKPTVSSIDLTLRETMMMWLKTRYRKIEITSYDKYENIIESNYAYFKIGSYQITSITPDMVSEFLATLAESYSFSSISSFYYVLRSTLKYAVGKEIIPPFNFDAVEIPNWKYLKVQGKEVRIITPDDSERIYNEAMRTCVTGGYYHPSVYRMLVFIMYTGLRVGEAIGLRWEDVDKNFAYIRVRHSVERVKRRNSDGTLAESGFRTELKLKAPKSLRSNRTIPLPVRARRILKELHREDSKPDEYVFKSKKGNVLKYGSVFSAFKILINDAGCDYNDYTIHGLRHTYGSMLISRGVDIKIVSELLGHTSVSFTYDIYIGVLKEDKIKAIGIFDLDEDEE